MAHMIEKLYGVRAGARGVAPAAVRACRGQGRERDLAAVAATRAAGGTVALAPTASPTGRQAILRDPDGGLFTATAA